MAALWDTKQSGLGAKSLDRELPGPRKEPSMARTVGIAFGIGTHLLFAFTVWQLFMFLAFPASGPDGSLMIDTLLAIQFGAVHSVLLFPKVRNYISERWVPAPLYGCFYCVAACASILVTIAGWQPHGPVLWNLSGAARLAVQLAFGASWVALFYSLSLTGLGYQTGFTPWWSWIKRREPPRREFRPTGLYRVLRHPVYLSFLGLIWWTPVMTIDHAILTGFWTVYVFTGSILKDRRLLYYIGDVYRSYQSHVPGYPGMIFGPLARIPLPGQRR